MPENRVILCVPCVLAETPGKKILIDLYFIDKLENIYRNALLLYPAQGITKECNPNSIILEKQSFTEEDIRKIMLKIIDEAKSFRLKRSREWLKKHRISLLFPTKILEKKTFSSKDKIVENEWEVNGALAILDSVFGDIHASKIRVKLIGNSFFIKVFVEKKEKRILFKSSNNILQKNYSWLYSNDSLFREEINNILSQY
jgi:hypothetical protein